MNMFARLGLTATAVAAIGVVGLTLLRGPVVGPAVSPSPTSELGIFAPIAGRIVSGIWAIDPIAVDPSAPSRSTPVRLGPEEVLALGWSSDGTELLFMRKDPTDQTFPYANQLYILHADGTETQLNKRAMDFAGATIAPDGSRVVYGAADDGLYVVDAEGGQPVRIAEEGYSPTFSPDGTQIAYLVDNAGSSEAHVWVADADGSDAHEILAEETALIEGDQLAWSPAGDRIALGDANEDRLAIYTFAPDGSDFTKVITGGMNPFWSPDGSHIAYMRPYDGPFPGLAIADADGSNVREFGFAASGPWHPGTLEEGAEASASPSKSPAAPSPSASPQPSPSPGFSTFSSAIHGISIDYPSAWQTRPATEPWTGGELTFYSAAADVIFDPALGDGVYLLLASLPNIGHDDFQGEVMDWLCKPDSGVAGGSYRFDGAKAWAVRCPGATSPDDNAIGNGGVFLFTDTRGYLIRGVVSSDEPALVETYDWHWLKSVLETVDLRPEEAVEAPSPSESP